MNLKDLIKKNKSVFSMLVFTAIFYSFASFALIFSPGKDPVSKETVKTGGITAKEISEREEVFKKNIQKNPRLFSVLGLVFLLALFSGVAADIYILIKKISGQSVIARGVPLSGVPWGLRELFQVFVFLLFFEACIGFSEIVLNFFVPLKSMNRDLLLFINNFVRSAGLVVFLMVVVGKKIGAPLSALGLTTRDFFRNVLTGFGGYVSAIPPLALALFLLTLAAQAFSYEPPPQAVVEIYLKPSTDPYLLFFTFFVAAAGPVVEEIFFRGFAYNAFRGRFGVKRAAVFSAALFGILHWNFFIFLPIFFLGLFLAYLYEKTGSLVPSITAHVTHNLVMVGLTLIFKTFSAGS